MTLSCSETRTAPVNEQQSAYCDMSSSIFVALSGVSAAEAGEICQRRVKRRTRRMNFFMAALTFRDGLASQGMRDCIPKTLQCSCSRLARLLLDHVSRILVFAKSDELRMSQPIDLRFILHLLIERATLWTNGSIYP